MSSNKKNTRRQFLKNTSIVALSAGVIPSLAFGISEKPSVLSTPALKPDCNPATEDAYGQGPFYTPDAPTIENDLLATNDEPGIRMIISGQVMNLDCSESIPDTEIDVWHADDSGAYDNNGYNLRGKTTSNNQGFYIFDTIKPGKYLNGDAYRPSHIHFKITPPGFETFITQLYFEGDDSIPGDFAASMTSGEFDATHRIIPLTENANGDLEGTWDIIVDGDGIPIGTNNLHLDKGMIYNVGPNPFEDQIQINYGVFQKSSVSLFVYDLNGHVVANIEEQILDPQKYNITWSPEKTLPSGYYFVALRINDLQVHYIKILKQ